MTGPESIHSDGDASTNDVVTEAERLSNILTLTLNVSDKSGDKQQSVSGRGVGGSGDHAHSDRKYAPSSLVLSIFASLNLLESR